MGVPSQQNLLVRTMDGWNKRVRIAESAEHDAWNKEMQVQRDGVSQSGAAEELFSEEAFSHPDFCSSKLPDDFTAEVHANIFEN